MFCRAFFLSILAIFSASLSHAGASTDAIGTAGKSAHGSLCRAAAEAYFGGLSDVSAEARKRANALYANADVSLLARDEEKLKALMPGAYPPGVPVFYIDPDRKAFLATLEDIGAAWTRFSQNPKVIDVIDASSKSGWSVEYENESGRVGFVVSRRYFGAPAPAQIHDQRHEQSYDQSKNQMRPFSTAPPDTGWQIGSAKYIFDPRLEKRPATDFIAVDALSPLAKALDLAKKFRSYEAIETPDFKQGSPEWLLKRKQAEATLAFFVGSADGETGFSWCQPTDLAHFYLDFGLTKTGVVAEPSTPSEPKRQSGHLDLQEVAAAAADGQVVATFKAAMSANEEADRADAAADAAHEVLKATETATNWFNEQAIRSWQRAQNMASDADIAAITADETAKAATIEAEDAHELANGSEVDVSLSNVYYQIETAKARRASREANQDASIAAPTEKPKDTDVVSASEPPAQPASAPDDSTLAGSTAASESPIDSSAAPANEGAPNPPLDPPSSAGAPDDPDP